MEIERLSRCSSAGSRYWRRARNHQIGESVRHCELFATGSSSSNPSQNFQAGRGADNPRRMKRRRVLCIAPLPGFGQRPAVRKKRISIPANSGRLTSILKLKPLGVRRNFVRMRMPGSRAASQAADALHGGAVVALADTCAAIGTINLLPDGYTTVTSELKINFTGNIK